MAKMMKGWARYKPTKRRLIQLYAALLQNAHLKGFVEGEIYTGSLKQACVPGLNCYSCPGAVGACPLGALQNALASSGARAPYYVLGILLLFGLILGRTICGWLCPMGLIQELLHKLPTPKVKKGRVTRALSWVKFAILEVFVVAIPLVYSLQHYPVPAFCKYICPAGTLEGAVGLLAHPANAEKLSMLGILFTRKFLIMVILAAACVFVYRAFCRFLCPLGAIYGLFAKVSLLGIQVTPARCTDCGRCVTVCPMDIRRVGDHECISCGRCVGACPTQAIAWKGGKCVLPPNEIQSQGKAKGRWLPALLIALAAVLLVIVLALVNQPVLGTRQPEAPEGLAVVVPEYSDDTPTGQEVGMRPPDFVAPRYGAQGGEFSLKQQRGKVVVINFWATWCAPCCGELPYFQRLSEAYPEDVAVIALHSHLVTEDVQAYLEQQGYTLPFALDEGGAIIRSLGGSTMLPMTVVLDRAGKITYNAVGSVTYEKLESLILPLL